MNGPHKGKPPAKRDDKSIATSAKPSQPQSPAAASNPKGKAPAAGKFPVETKGNIRQELKNFI